LNNGVCNVPKKGCECNTDADCVDANPCTIDKCVMNKCTEEPGHAGDVCRPATSVCDVAEVCSGTSVECPPDKVNVAGTPCRAAISVCDVTELCDGERPYCPPDAVAVADTLCRSASLPCDVEERCDGSSPICPRDLVAEAGVACSDGEVRECHVGGVCDGSAAQCPNGRPLPDGAACDDQDACTRREACFGGVCGGGTFVCGCRSDEDCAPASADGCRAAQRCDVDTRQCIDPAPSVGARCVLDQETASRNAEECRRHGGTEVNADRGVCDGSGACIARQWFVFAVCVCCCCCV
jgi:hypothetical protein